MSYARTRERDNTSPFYEESVGVWNDTKNNTNGIAYQWPISVTVGSSEVMSDRVVSRYAERSARGAIFNNPMSKSMRELIVSPGHLSQVYPLGGGKQRDESWSPYWRPFSVLGTEALTQHLGHGINIANLYDKAGTDARANVAAPDLQGAVSLGELRETLSFLRNPAKALLKFANEAKASKRKLKSDRLHELKTVADFVGDNWLAYRYAVRPIQQDIQGGMDALFRLAQENPVRLTARGYASDSSNTSQTYTYSSGATFRSTKTTNTTVTIRAGVLYEQGSGFDPYGFGNAEIPLAAWEMIPFSFVVDWFANIGSFIGALTPRVGVTNLASWTTTEVKQETTLLAECISLPSPRYITSSSPCSCTFRTESKTRTPGVGLGLAYNPTPYPKDWFGAKRVADTLALANSIFRSR